MFTQRNPVAGIAAAVLACAAVVQGVQNPPVQPRPPVRDQSATPRVPVGTASITGTVLLAASGLPARRARVTLSGGDAPGRNTTTDEQGRFAFTALPAGRYSLSATKAGHIAGQYGQPRPGRPGTPIQLDDGQKFDAKLQLARGSVLTGTILDEDGEPLPGTQVRALRFVLQNGIRSLVQAGAGSTDDRGIYRIYGLQPGDYIVGATPRNTSSGPEPEALRNEIMAMRERMAATARTDETAARVFATRIAAMEHSLSTASDEQPTGYAAVYYPGTTAPAQAAPIALGAGEERPGLDFQLQRVPVARVEGTVINSTNQSLQNIQVSLIDIAQAAPGIGNNSTRADNEGRFRFANIAPGQYRIVARAMVGERGAGRGEAVRVTPDIAGRSVQVAPAEQTRLWGSLDISVDGRDLSNVMLALQPGVSLSGRLVFQGTTLQPPADLTRMRVNVAPAAPGPNNEFAGAGSGRVDASGKFTITGITPGKYRLTSGGAAQGWIVESAVVDGQDTLDFPFEVKGTQNVGSAVITFSDQRAELSGTLTDSRAQPAVEYTVILYPADQRYWMPQSRRIRNTRPATDGRFNFGTIPPGEYKIAPVFDVEPGSWFDPAFLQQLDATALRVSVAEGEKKIQNVRIAAGG